MRANRSICSHATNVEAYYSWMCCDVFEPWPEVSALAVLVAAVRPGRPAAYGGTCFVPRPADDAGQHSAAVNCVELRIYRRQSSPDHRRLLIDRFATPTPTAQRFSIELDFIRHRLS